ncbi:hypothetical protein [Oceanicoccus sp. KOV_DT_Chl]|uniref:hypothetical protein n=1 Tax=Oceanicoccus sp. KOV_DT_Chl TaxID=1904639 RepID=UPI000C7C9D48|nr:hypothetical protein [Oceanicoccus sp. KOV_DT_Chl]
MKVSIFTIFILILAPSIYAQDMGEGIWLTGEDGRKVKTYYRNGEWFGKLISSDNAGAPIGTDVLRHIILENGVWKGQVYAVKRDMLIDAIIEPADEKIVINISVGMFSKTLEWYKETVPK